MSPPSTAFCSCKYFMQLREMALLTGKKSCRRCSIMDPNAVSAHANFNAYAIAQACRPSGHNRGAVAFETDLPHSQRPQLGLSGPTVHTNYPRLPYSRRVQSPPYARLHTPWLLQDCFTRPPIFPLPSTPAKLSQVPFPTVSPHCLFHDNCD